MAAEERRKNGFMKKKSRLVLIVWVVSLFLILGVYIAVKNSNISSFRYEVADSIQSDLANKGRATKQDNSTPLRPIAISSKYKRYVNPLMSYAIKYPSSFNMDFESGDSKGAFFSFAGIKLSVGAYYNVLDENIDDIAADKKDAVYSNKINNTCVFSGYTSDSKIYYEKYAIYSGGSIIAFARLEYPPHMKEQLDNVIPKIFKYFPNRRDCPPYDPNYYVAD